MFPFATVLGGLLIEEKSPLSHSSYPVARRMAVHVVVPRLSRESVSHENHSGEIKGREEVLLESRLHVFHELRRPDDVDRVYGARGERARRVVMSHKPSRFEPAPRCPEGCL